MDRQWKRFGFFSKHVIQNPSVTTDAALKNGSRVRTRGKRNNDHLDIKRIDITASTCCIAEKAIAAAANTAHSGTARHQISLTDNEHPILVLGDSKGSIHFVDVMGNGIVQEMPKAHQGVITQLQYAEQAGVVVSVGGGEHFRTPEEIAFSNRVVEIAEKEIRLEADHDRGKSSVSSENGNNKSARNFGNLTDGQDNTGAAAPLPSTSGGDRMHGGSASSGSNRGSSSGSGSGGGASTTSSPTLKFWTIKDGGGGLFFPNCTGSIPIFGGQYPRPEQVVCCAVLPNLSQIAVGLSNGACMVLRGDFLRKPDSVRRIIIQSAGEHPVTNVKFTQYIELDPTRIPTANKAYKRRFSKRGGQHDSQSKNQNVDVRIGLYVTTNERLISYPNLDLDEKKSQNQKLLIQGIILDQQGCRKGCLTVDMEGNAVVGHDEGVFFYRPRERGPCYVFDGPKRHVLWCGQYMVVLTNQNNTGSRLQVYDLRHKFVACTVSLRGGGGGGGGMRSTGKNDSSNKNNKNNKNTKSSVQQSITTLATSGLSALSTTELARLDAAIRGDGDVEYVVNCGSSSLFVITNTHRVYMLQENSLENRLKELYQKHLYTLALRVVDHANEEATAEASALSSRSTSTSSGNTPIILVHPASIHKRHGDHLYDKGDYDGSVHEYIRTIGHLDSSVVIRKFLDAQQILHLTSYLEAYHKDINIKPMSEHTTLLIHCYTKKKNDASLHAFLGLNMKSNSNNTRINIQSAVRALRDANYADEALELSRRDNDHPTYLQILLETDEDALMTKPTRSHDEIDADKYDKAREALIYIRKLPFLEAEITLLAHAKDLVSSAPHETTTLLMELCTPTSSNKDQLFSNPEAYLPAFVDYSDREKKFSHHEELQRFLWHVVKKESATVKVWNTLLELCLTSAMSAQDVDASTLASNNVKTILEDKNAKYDVDQALVLVQRHGFSAGQLYLYEKRKMYHMIIQHYMDSGDHRAILSTGKKYGDRDSNVWRKILVYYANMSAEDTPLCEPYIIQALSYLSKQQSSSSGISPMLVVNILSKNKRITLAVIRDYLVQHCQVTAKITAEAEEETHTITQDTEELKKRVVQLETNGIAFQNTKDHLIDTQPLDLPSIHFMSGHSYNLDNLTEMDDGTRECPHTGSDHKRSLDTAVRLKERSIDNENFYRELSDAASNHSGIECIADYFGRALMTPMEFLESHQTVGGGGGSTSSRRSLNTSANPFT